MKVIHDGPLYEVKSYGSYGKCYLIARKADKFFFHVIDNAAVTFHELIFTQNVTTVDDAIHTHYKGDFLPAQARAG